MHPVLFPTQYFPTISPLVYGNPEKGHPILGNQRFRGHRYLEISGFADTVASSNRSWGGGIVGVRTHRTFRLFQWKLVASIALWAGVSTAQDRVAAEDPQVSITPRTPPRDRATSEQASLKVDVNMILLPVTVTDARDQPVTDLSPDAFRVLEDNVEQKVVSFHREEGPVSVGFIFDASNSMKNRIDRSVAAIQKFVDTLTTGDEFFLVRFSDRPSLVTSFTEDPQKILDDLSSIQPQGWTALNDAIWLGVQTMKHAKNSRRALIVLTDGGDNNSRYSDSELRKLVQESDVRIYSIGLFERSSFLEKLGMDSGGRAFWAHKMDDLPKTIDKLSTEFRNQYVLGYYPNEHLNDGKYRRVRVEIIETIKKMPLNVFWRRGYYSPGE
jgi:Ca-activated chloride channel homolog